MLDGSGVLSLAGAEHALEPESGAYLAPGESYELEADEPGPLRLVSVLIPDPDAGAAVHGERRVVRRLADQEAEAATAEREFRIVADPAAGCARPPTSSATSRPPARPSTSTPMTR